MRIRTKILITTSTISLLALLVLSVGGLQLLNRATELRAQSRLAEAQDAIARLLDARKSECLAAVKRASEYAETREILAQLSAPGTTADVVQLARELRESEGLDLFSIVAEDGTVLSRAHWPESFGILDPSARILCDESHDQPVITTRQVRDSTLIVLVSCSLCEVRGGPYYIEGGYRIGPSFAKEMGILLGMDVSILLPETEEGRDVPGLREERASEQESLELPLIGLYDEEAAQIVLRLPTDYMRDLRIRLVRFAILVAGIAFAAGLLFAFLSARRITMGLEDLAVAAESLTERGFRFSVPRNADYEVRKLSESFSRMSEELQESRHRLQLMERVAAWRDLARVLAHEIRNALSPIRLSIESIRTSLGRGGSDAADIVDKCGRTIEEEVKSLETMVAEFASFAKLPEPSRSPQEINRVVREAVALFSAMMSDIELVENYGPNSLSADLDKHQARRAIGNIILNAIEAMPDGGTLDVQTFRRVIGSRPYAVVRISDSGGGIEKEDRDRIFTPYFTTKEKGTGLGLAVAQSILISHGGRIELDETRDGEGTAFVLYFPA